MKYSPSKSCVIALVCASLFTAESLRPLKADTPAPIVPHPEEARNYLQLGYVLNSCYSEININASNVTLEELAQRVHKAMLALNSPSHAAPPIEVRKANRVRLNFAVKGTTPRKILASAGQLANVQLWVFADHILLAPESALTPAEVESTKKKLGLRVELKDFLNPATISGESRSSLMAVIAGNISPSTETPEKATPTANGTGGTAKPASKTWEKVPLGDLPKESQAMLHLIIKEHNAINAQLAKEYSQESPWMLSTAVPDFVTAKDSTVTITDEGGSLLIETAESDKLSFAFNLRSSKRELPRPKSPETPTAPPLLDPSAHNS